MAELKQEVAEFWDRASCGEVYGGGALSQREQYENQARARYQLEPYIASFARFSDARGRDVLEIGVGMGADHAEIAKAEPRSLHGIDLTPRAIEHTRARLEILGLDSSLQVGDAEHLPFEANSFDMVYSWGVLHHSPDTPQAVREVHRVLRPGGRARIMIYQTRSLVGYMLWLRYALLRGRPGRSLADIYANHLESPGTKAYSVEEAREMFSAFASVEMTTQLSFGDLLLGEVGQRHRGALLSAARALWPRPLIRSLLGGYGLYLLIEVRK